MSVTSSAVRARIERLRLRLGGRPPASLSSPTDQTATTERDEAASPAEIPLETRLKELKERLLARGVAPTSPLLPDLSRGGLPFANRPDVRSISTSTEPPAESGAETASWTPRTTQAARFLQAMNGHEAALHQHRADLAAMPELAPVLDPVMESAASLIALARQGIRTSPNAATELHFVAGLRQIDRHLARQLAELSDAVERQRATLDLHRRATALLTATAETLTVPIRGLQQLCDQIIADAEAREGLTIDTTRSSGLAERLGCHAINTARVIIYLTRHEVGWKAYRRSLVAAAVMQDAGLLRLADAVGGNAGLAASGRAALERHPPLATALLEKIPGLDGQFAAAAGDHHERLDGSGYPAGKRGDQLSPSARLLAVADMYAALREPRPYRNAYSQKQALSALLSSAEAGVIDQAWSRALLDQSFFPIGSVVELSTGEWAEVVAGPSIDDDLGRAAKPVVRMLAASGLRDAVGEPVLRPSRRYRNLTQHPDCRVIRVVDDMELPRWSEAG